MPFVRICAPITDVCFDYVKNGGAVVVQYQTPEFDHNFGPYPYSMTSNPEEVTDEHSVVTILDPDNAAMKWPNVITRQRL